MGILLRFNVGIRCWLLLMTIALYGQPVFSQTDYLDSLQGEAESLVLDEKTHFNDTSQSSAPGVVNEDDGGEINPFKAGLSQQDFESLLKTNYLGSYLFYNRLSAAKKAAVYQFYLDNPDAAGIRSRILAISKE